MKQLTKEEFEIYALLYAAYFDLKITEVELSMISAEVEPHIFNMIFQLFKSDDDVERINKILKYKDLYIKNEKEKEEFLRNIQEILLSDKKYNQNEIIAFTQLKKLVY